MIATKLFKIDGFDNAYLYKLSKPLEELYDYVIVSAINNNFGIETYIFPANELGEITDWGELDGSQKGIVNPDRVLEDLGYEIVETK